jgi:hypothetical protein
MTGREGSLQIWHDRHSAQRRMYHMKTKYMKAGLTDEREI